MSTSGNCRWTASYHSEMSSKTNHSLHIPSVVSVFFVPFKFAPNIGPTTVGIHFGLNESLNVVTTQLCRLLPASCCTSLYALFLLCNIVLYNYVAFVI